MSKRLEATISCPNCQHQFQQTLYRTIWGEYPENRQLVMEDDINVAECPSCSKRTKVSLALMYTNAPRQFAVWWEPEYDSQIDEDAAGYRQMLGASSHLAKAPRIKDWEEFKETIRKFEISNPPVELRGKTESTGSSGGCLGILVTLTAIPSILIYALH